MKNSKEYKYRKAKIPIPRTVRIGSDGAQIRHAEPTPNPKLSSLLVGRAWGLGFGA